MSVVTGNVMTTGQEPIADATIMVVSGPTHPDLAVLTNERGIFRLGLDPGIYILEVHADGYVSARGRVRVPPVGTIRGRIVLQEEESVPEID